MAIIKKPIIKKIKPVGKRSQTGIAGFDPLVQGGFPLGSSILIAGGPGTGKSIFSLQYLISGATKYKEKGLYVSFEQTTRAIKNQASQFGWNISSLEKSGMLTIKSIPTSKMTKETMKEIHEFVKANKIKRLVIDSLSTIVVNAPIYTVPSELSVEDVVGENVVFSPPIIGDYVVKRFIYNFIESLRYLDCTSLLISEAGKDGEFITRDTLSEFVCDGVILITFESMGGAFSRSLIVRKMRHTKNDEDVHPVEISNKGIIVHKIE